MKKYIFLLLTLVFLVMFAFAMLVMASTAPDERKEVAITAPGTDGSIVLTITTQGQDKVSEAVVAAVANIPHQSHQSIGDTHRTTDQWIQSQIDDAIAKAKIEEQFKQFIAMQTEGTDLCLAKSEVTTISMSPTGEDMVSVATAKTINTMVETITTFSQMPGGHHLKFPMISTVVIGLNNQTWMSGSSV